MEHAPEDKGFLNADRTTHEDDKAGARKMGDVVNLLQSNLVRITRLMWFQFFFMGALIILFFITYFSLLMKSPFVSDIDAPAQKSSEKPSSAAEITVSPQISQTQPSVKAADNPEWQEVQEILDQLRKAQLEKNINLFLRAYSPTFPNLAGKKESLLKSWHRYNYLNMNFNIVNIQRQNAHTIIAEVAWNITLEDVRSKKKVALMKNYIINFSKVSGKPLIQEVTERTKTIKGAA